MTLDEELLKVIWRCSWVGRVHLEHVDLHWAVILSHSDLEQRLHHIGTQAGDICATYISPKLIVSITWTRWIGLRDRYGERTRQKENWGDGWRCVCLSVWGGWTWTSCSLRLSTVFWHSNRHKKDPEPHWKAIKLFWVSLGNLFAVCRNTWSKNNSVKVKDKKRNRTSCCGSWVWNYICY